MLAWYDKFATFYTKPNTVTYEWGILIFASWMSMLHVRKQTQRRFKFGAACISYKIHDERNTRHSPTYNRTCSEDPAISQKYKIRLNIHPAAGCGGFKQAVFLLQNNKNSVSSIKYKKVNQIGYGSLYWNFLMEILVITSAGHKKDNCKLGSGCNWTYSIKLINHATCSWKTNGIKKVLIQTFYYSWKLFNDNLKSVIARYTDVTIT